jgi:hypothetical protein
VDEREAREILTAELHELRRRYEELRRNFELVVGEDTAQ